MIARVWTAWATQARASTYAEHLQTHVLPRLRAINGFAGGSLLRRDAEGETELVVVTRWRSPDAVRAFAGDDPDVAVVDEAAAAMLTRYDARVRHYEIVSENA